MKKLLSVLLTLLILGGSCVSALAIEPEEIAFNNIEGCKTLEKRLYSIKEITAAQLLAQTTPASVKIEVNGTELEADSPVPTGAKISLSDGETTLDEYLFILLGDVDCNGRVNALDARLALRVATHLENDLKYVQLLAMDVDSDVSETATDARSILRAATKLENCSNWLALATTEYDCTSVLVVMEKAHSVPGRVYTADFFDEELVESVEDLTYIDPAQLGSDASITDFSKWHQILALKLKEPSIDNVELLIRKLAGRDEIMSAGKNGYIYTMNTNEAGYSETY
ncbi:MAG: hypothetical protein GX851_01315 [Clostridiales bacterium]|nr:hypothetical protein [Clostridiales bacterium]